MRTGIALWITGLPGSGKSTLAEALKEAEPGFHILRMDELRKVATPEPTYSEGERDILYRALVYIAWTLAGLGHDVIIDATGNLRKWRQLARGLLPAYAEVYLKCPLSLCMERERRRPDTRQAPKRIYEKARKGWPVPGVSAPYEEPLRPEVTIEVPAMGLGEQVRVVREALAGLRSRQRREAN
jgi:adenylylsulfate kinase